MTSNNGPDVTDSLDKVLEGIEIRNTKKTDDDISTVTDPNSSLHDGSKKNMNSKEEEEISPWSQSYFGVPVNYFCVGIMLGGSTSILYPILIVQQGVSSSLYTASISIVTIFWSYKIIFGTLSDCFPIFGYHRKSYMTLGWILCATVLSKLASMGTDVDSTRIVLMLTLANLGYVMADVSADGFMVWIAHKEPMHKRGRMQTLVYATNSFGQIIVNLVILFGFSGPHVNCPGYQEDEAIPCTNNINVMARNQFAETFPETWCYMTCKDATFSFGLTIPTFAWMIAAVNIISIPFYVMLKEEKTPPVQFKAFMGTFWRLLKRRASWQIILYIMVSQITFGVTNAAKIPANYVWLNLTTFQNQIMVLMEKFIFFIGLNLLRKHALNSSWRKLIWAGSMLSTFFNLLYFIIVFDLWRNPWFYIFTDVSAQFMYTLNFMASLLCMVEVAEPGFESITYSLITTASNTVTPLSAVISYQFLAFFPALNSQKSIKEDTPEVRKEFATLHMLVILVNLSSLIALPMLPRQKKEVREIVESGETSTFWSYFSLISAFIFLVYSTVVTFMTVASADVYGCYKILGGGGCSADESSTPACILVGLAFLYCYGVNFTLSFLPIIRGKQKWSWSIFV